ncbi:MAG: hypothetical protein A2W29_08350 [Gemmatimonadetes bacterium RBG_16_66_8]|nr:MAG: hypothetical protein A2W29_08350 [Gemmatimonadetes bacterium RBG_16_66_8]
MAVNADFDPATNLDAELAAKGLTRSASAPDVFVHYHASVRDRLDVYRVDREAGYTAAYADGEQALVYEEGTLLVDLVEAASNRDSTANSRGGLGGGGRRGSFPPWPVPERRRTAPAPRSNMDAAEYKHVVLGLIFLKYISDAFEERPALNKQQVGELIDLIGTVGLGDAEHRSRDVLGRVYEDFLGKFASAEGRQSGQFYTPRHVVRLLVDMLAPYKGRVFDPCCGSGGTFVQSEKSVEVHGGRVGDIAVYGQESNQTTLHSPRFSSTAGSPTRKRRSIEALEVNDRAVKVLGDETLKTIARELIRAVKGSATIDWTVKDTVRAQMQVMVKRILKKHGYQPDTQEQTVRTDIEQAELLAQDWAA